MAILFDLDGTLCDTGPDFYRAINLLRQEESTALIPYDQLRPWVSYGSQTMIQKIFQLNDSEQDQKEIARLKARFLDLYAATEYQQTQLFPGISHLLQTLTRRKIPWGIVTNKPHKYTKGIIHRIPDLQTASCIVSGDTTPYSKPHPEPLFYACERLNCFPSDCLYIGDAERDMIAGKSAGMTTLGVLFGYIHEHETTNRWPADMFISCAIDILPWIEQWLENQKK